VGQVEQINVMERLVGGLLRTRYGAGAADGSTAICSTPHLDEDSLNAFVEGRLSDGELSPIVSHLVECGPCRNASAQLLRLSDEVVFDEAPRPEMPREPGKLKRFLDDLAARIFTNDENAVLAYHAEDEEAKGNVKNGEAAPNESKDHEDK
jgi:hypothetical protein